MQPPTAREARLETLLSERDIQLSELHDEVARLQTYLPSQPTLSIAAPLSLPPAVSSILLSQLSASIPGSASSNSSTVVAALTQRARLLQEENDELYELLRYSETGKLKEEVRGLRRLVQRLQSALRQSHETINLLSRELDKSYESYLSVAQPTPSPQLSPPTYPPSPRAASNYTASAGGNGSHGAKLPPTGPRAQKRPRLAETNSHPFANSGKSRSTSHNHYTHSAVKRGVDGHPKRSDKDSRGGNDGNKGGRPSKMDIDNERPPSSEPSRGRDKDAGREFDRDWDRGRERNKDRDRDRGPKDQDHTSRDRERGSNAINSRRGGNGPGRGGGRRGDRPGGTAFHGTGGSSSNSAHNANGDRTLAERMGL